jgi:starch synthase
MTPQQKKKILYISHEFNPYNIETDMAEALNELAVLSNKEGYEVRCIMPRFGTINERRHKLHEVVRLSGINIHVDREDYPLIIKVASLPNARLQMYFMDNEDMFKRKQVFHDEEENFFEDNAERTIFFCKSAIETVKKFGWPPDIIFIHGWMGGLIPALIKHQFKNEPVFAESTIIYSASKEMTNESLGERFGEMLSNSTQLKSKVVSMYKDGANHDMYLGGAKNSDIVCFSHPEVSAELTKAVKPTKSKKVLKFNPEEEDLNTIIELYAEILPEEEEED